jgi:hypothetical protein
LESVCWGNSTVGSNPTLSAKVLNYNGHTSLDLRFAGETNLPGKRFCKAIVNSVSSLLNFNLPVLAGYNPLPKPAQSLENVPVLIADDNAANREMLTKASCTSEIV